ncbi:ABC transporter substrate-binding protein [Dactylosporangium cerinum]
MRALAAGLGLAAVLSACSSTDTAAGQSGGAPRPGGTLTYALATSPDQLDPARSGLNVAGRVLRSIFDSLVSLQPDGSVQPWLATKWDISADGTAYTFTLRDDVRFQDATPLNADAVKFTFDRILAPQTKSLTAKFQLNALKSTEVLDARTVRLTLNKPSSALLTNLASPFLGIVSPTAAAKQGDQFTRHPVGSGPYEFVRWDTNSQIVLKRNPGYAWAQPAVKNRGAGHLDEVVFRIVPEDATRIGGAQGGELLAAEKVPAQLAAGVERDKRLRLVKERVTGLPYSLIFNQKQQPWDDVRLRKAVRAGLDVESIVKTLYLGTYERAWSAVTPGVLGYDASLERSYQPDVAEAKHLLDEAGWTAGPDGVRVKGGTQLVLRYVGSYPNNEKSHDIAQLVQQQLKAVGIKVDVDVSSNVAELLTKTGEFDVYPTGTAAVDPDALSGFYSSRILALVNGTQDLAGIADPDIDAWLDEGAASLDSQRRAELYKQVQRKLIDQVALIPIYAPTYTVAASRKVQGLAFDPLNSPIINDAYLAG